MNDPIPTVHLRNAWRGSHPWIFQKLVDKPAQRPKPGSVVDVVGVDGTWIGRGFYNGHSRIALRMLEADPDVAIDAAWFAHRIGERSEEHTSELQSLMRISYAVFCLKKKKQKQDNNAQNTVD